MYPNQFYLERKFYYQKIFTIFIFENYFQIKLYFRELQLSLMRATSKLNLILKREFCLILFKRYFYREILSLFKISRILLKHFS